MDSDDVLERLRSESGLSIDRDGRFLHRGEPITHARTLEVLWSSLTRVPDGRYLVRIGRESGYVTIDDAPYAVRGVLDGDGVPVLVLSDGTRESLDPATLAVDGEGVLRCVVKGGHAARFTRAAQVALGLMLDEDPPGSGTLTLTVRGRRWPVRKA
ncbi:MAG TPA: hypothetical protein VD838_16185 [Anaeromyxobacteraceae bacterium]|nr:hypothetical protein [Anaeromyxobacteraceae bacterium]